MILKEGKCTGKSERETTELVITRIPDVQVEGLLRESHTNKKQPGFPTLQGSAQFYRKRMATVQSGELSRQQSKSRKWGALTSCWTQGKGPISTAQSQPKRDTHILLNTERWNHQGSERKSQSDGHSHPVEHREGVKGTILHIQVKLQSAIPSSRNKELTSKASNMSSCNIIHRLLDASRSSHGSSTSFVMHTKAGRCMTHACIPS
jgi:hypothetical protein